MRPFQLLVFDWDGTLMDSEDRIVGSARGAMVDLGLQPRSDEAIRDIIGLGLREAMQVLYPELPPESHAALVERYRLHFLSEGGLCVCSSQSIVPVTVSSGKAKYPESAEADLKRIFPRLIYTDAQGIAHGLGNIKAANMVVLGAASKSLGLPDECWAEAIKESVAPKHLELNQKAFEAGRNLK